MLYRNPEGFVAGYSLKDAGALARAYPAEGKTHDTINSELGLSGDNPAQVKFEFWMGY
jgi:hypothetical protein